MERNLVGVEMLRALSLACSSSEITSYPLSNHTLKYLSPSAAVWGSNHPVVALVPDPVWEEDGSLRWHDCKF